MAPARSMRDGLVAAAAPEAPRCRIRAIRTIAFRNLSDTVVEPGPGLNVFEGSNGQGKTNLLEAVVLLSGLRSFRGARFADLVAAGADEFVLEARVDGLLGSSVIRHEWRPRGRRIRLDERPVRRASELLRQIPVIFFGPDDLSIAKGPPAGRRAFVDEGVVLTDPDRADELRAYADTLRQRNRLLRDVAAGTAAREELVAWTRTFVAAARRVRAARDAFLADYAAVFAQTMGEVSGGLHAATVTARPSDPPDEQDQDAWQRMIDRDVAAQTSRLGPHRDDCVITIDGHDVSGWASQGQLRLVVIAMKIALLHRVAAARRCVPVLLLDDVSSELDQQRSQLLSAYLRAQGGQVLATTTSADAVGLGRDAGEGPVTRFDVSAGRIICASSP